MDIFKKLLPDKKLPCILCNGKGEIEVAKDKIEVRFGIDPQHCTEQELALVMAHVPKLWELPGKFGLDATKIKLTFEFKESGHKMPVMLARQADGTKN